MILRYSVLIRSCLLLVFWLAVSPGCQTQRPLMKEDSGEPKAATSAGDMGVSPSGRGEAVSGIMESEEGQPEEMEVISTPFGLVKRSKKRFGSSPFQGPSSPEARPDSQVSLLKAPPEFTLETAPEMEPVQEKEELPKDTREFIAHKIVTEDIPSPLPEAGSEDIVLNFDNADLREVIRAVAEILRFNYIVDPSVRGDVTIHTTGTLKTTDLFNVFLQILETQGFTAVRSGSIYEIVPFKESSRMPVISRFGREEVESLRPEERIIMQIIPLNHISAAEMGKVLEPFVSSEGTIVTHDRSNILIIVDRGTNILKSLRLVEAFDIDLFQNYTHQWFSVQYMDAEEMAKTLTDLLKAYGKGEKDFQLIAIKRLNRIIAISPDKPFLTKIEGFIKEFDQPDEMVEPRIYVYFMRNGQAEDFADILMSIFSADTGERRRTGAAEEAKEPIDRRILNPFDSQARAQAQAAVSAARGGGVAQGSGTLRGTLKITPDAIRNALIIEAIPSDYQIVEDILDQLDVLPRQVLIEVVIAEVSFDAKDELGVEWSYTGGDLSSGSTELLSGQIGEAGLQFTVGQTDRWSATLSALATDNKANILSAPLVLASDNKEAKIDISDQLPVASASLATTGDNPITQTTIQYRNTGIILMVTPHINDRGLVSMDISQEVSEEGAGKNVGGVEYPSFRQRRVDTSLTVGDGQTIVLGGLMREKEEEGRSGVPFFSSLPVVGFLFGKDTKERVKVDLMLFITPRVIVNLSDVDAITQEFQQKVSKLIFPKEKDENS
jgi:general secretion pathway protein D